MSLAIVQAEDQKHPDYLQQNINRTCFALIANVIATLQALGHDAAHVAKTGGEGQYTPPGFTPRPITGLDGKTYTCTGVSHDAIWCDGKQYDCIAGGNDSPDPITNPDGSHLRGTPAWNAIPEQYWRPQNPPITLGSAPVPQPQPQPIPIVPGREEALDEMNRLDVYYKSPEGLKRENGLSLNGKPDFEGIAAWYLDVYQQARVKGKTREEARAAYVSAIRHTDEWKQKHPGETP